MNRMIAYCGLVCDKCDAYKATVNDDWDLRVKTAVSWSELNNAQILPENINGLGCRQDGVKTVFAESLCLIRQCALKKDLESCRECEEKEKCQKVGGIISTSKEARDYILG